MKMNTQPLSVSNCYELFAFRIETILTEMVTRNDLIVEHNNNIMDIIQVSVSFFVVTIEQLYNTCWLIESIFILINQISRMQY